MRNDPLTSWAEARGFGLGLAGVEVLAAVRSEVEGRRASGEFAPGFYEENLASLDRLDHPPISHPRSVIILAVPKPVHVLTFKTGEKDIDTLLPPTYVRYRRTYEEVRDEVRRALHGTPYKVELLSAHLKLLAARIGLTRYGKNNIAYAEGMGSFLQLIGLLSDLPVADGAAPPRGLEDSLLDRCRTCRACVVSCPTGAIGEDRFLLHAERCYTLFSESMDPIPESLKPPTPECLVGCMKCQTVCPENKGRLKVEPAGTVFSLEETAALLRLAEGDESGLRAVQDRLRPLGLSAAPRLYGRNLKRLLEFSRR